MSRVGEVPGTIIFSVFYFLFSLGFLYESKEARGLGLTPEFVLTALGLVKDEENSFIQYHVRRTSGTIVLRSLLPFDHTWMFLMLKLSAALSVMAVSYAWYLSLNNYVNHPIIQKITAYAQGSVETLILDINHEFRRVDKVCVEVNSVTHLVITDNWILILGSIPQHFHICHQHDAQLTIMDSDSHSLSPEGDAGGAQYLSIQVTNRKPGIPGFRFRVNSLEYQNIQSKLQAAIQNIRNIQISKSVSDRFVDVFKAEVEGNPRAHVTDVLEPCIDACIFFAIEAKGFKFEVLGLLVAAQAVYFLQASFKIFSLGCMVNQANVKLVRVCGTTNAEENGVPLADRCVNCYCRHGCHVNFFCFAIFATFDSLSSMSKIILTTKYINM